MASRSRFGLRQEFLLALLPTAVVLLMLGAMKILGSQPLLFASLASSAFLIYLDPEHPANEIRTVLLAQGGAAVLGFGAASLFGPGYPAVGAAMVATIIITVALNVMHPPAISTSVSFAFRHGSVGDLSLFATAVLLVTLLVLLQHTSMSLLRRFRSR